MLYVSQSRKTYKGFGQWTIASILCSVGMISLSMRHFLPDLLTVVIANTLVIATYGFIAHGIEIFAGSTRRAWLFISLSVATFLSFTYFTFYAPDVDARIVINSVFLAILYGYCGYIVYRYLPRLIGGPSLLLTAAFTIQAIWFAFRIIPTEFSNAPIANFMNAPTFQGATILVYFVGNIFVIVGLIILNSQRVEIDLQTTMEEIKTLRGIIPICSSCKKIRNDEGIWNQIEAYIRAHSEAQFSHSLCPECMKKLYPDFYRE